MIGGFHKIPEALKDSIAAETFSEAITVKRRTLAYVEGQKAQSLSCIVAPLNATSSAGTRRGEQVDWLVGVYVIEQVAASTEAERLAREDALLSLTDEILAHVDSLKTVSVEGVDYPIFISPGIARLPIDPDPYQASKVFIGSFQATVKEH